MPVVYSMMLCTISCLVIHCMLNSCSCGPYHDCLSWMCPNTFKCNFKVELHQFTTVNLVSYTKLRVHVHLIRGLKLGGLQVFLFTHNAQSFLIFFIKEKYCYFQLRYCEIFRTCEEWGKKVLYFPAFFNFLINLSIIHYFC